MIFFDQFIVPTIKFGKCFAELMIKISIFSAFKYFCLMHGNACRICSNLYEVEKFSSIYDTMPI